MKAIADTSFVVALESKKDRDRQRCELVYQAAQFIILPQSTLNETCNLLTQERGNCAVASFLTRLPTMKYALVPLETIDIIRTSEILNQYADSRVDFVDASVIAVAERLNITHVLTLDRRDFGLVRPNHADHFEILP